MSARYTGGLVYNAPGGWSAQFSGSNYLSFATSQTPLLLGSSDFTVEAWVYRISGTGTAVVFAGQSDLSTVGGSSYVFYISSSATSDLYIGGSGYGISSPNPSLGFWAHVAWVRSGGTYSSYLNGVRVATRSDLSTGAVNNGSTSYAPAIGAFTNNTSTFTGYISNLRLIKGSGGYDATQSTITVPSGPLNVVTNTSLLTCRYSTIVDGSTNALTITNTGSVAVNNLNPFPTSQLPNPALGGAGNGVYTMSQYAALKAANLWPAYDPYYKNVTLNLHGNAGAVLPFNTDASTNNFQVTQVGDTRPSNYTPFITDGYWSNYFDGSSYLQVAYNAALDASTGPFTYECWLNPSTTTNKQYLGGSVTNAFFAFVGSGTIFVGRNNVAVDFTSSSGINTNQWNHVVIVRNSSNNIAIFINGVSAYYNASNTNNYGLASNPLRIGVATTGSSYEYSGYISNVRIAKSALYDPTASTITVPTSPLTAGSAGLLTCQSNRFVDNSSNAFAITTSGSPSVNPLQPFTAPTGTSAYGSGYFDGSGDSLTSSNNSAFNLGSNNFTVEAWVYVTATPGGSGAAIIGKNSATYPGGYEFNFVVDTGRTIFFGAYTTTLVSLQGAIVTSLNSWNHVAAVRSGSNWALFVNGVRDVTATSSGTVQTTSSSLYVGDYGGGSRNLTGYISNVRLVNGSAVYDPTASTLTIPTSPLTAITNTSLLTVQTNAPSQNNTFLDSSTNNFTITRNGNTTQGTFTPYGSNWSNYFNGSSGVTVSSTSSQFGFSGDFTWEAWINPSALPSSGGNYSIICSRGSVASNSAFQFLFGNSSGTYQITGTISIGSSDSNLVWNISGTPSVGTWYHVAIVRSGTSVQAYWNGTAIGSAQTASGTTNTPTVNPTIGFRGGSYNDLFFSGYISNFRMVGSAVYTSNFTPSTAPLTAISGTRLLTCADNRFIDDSTNAFSLSAYSSPSVQRFSPFTTAYSTSVIGGSGYFDGTTDFLTVPKNTALEPATSGAWTLETWVYITSTSMMRVVAYANSTISSGPDLGYYLTFYSANYITGGFYSSTTQYDISSSSTVAQINTWIHIALTSDGSTMRLFVNGVSSGTPLTVSGIAINAPSSATFKISNYSSSQYVTGYVTDTRFVKGTAVYTSNFTPPTAPLTAITNTSLLLSYTNAGILDNAMMNDLETVGNAQISTSVKKYGTGSMYFDGTSSSLSFSANLQNLQFGTGDFTIECWVNKSANGANSYDSVIGLGSTPNGTQGWYFEISTSRGIFFIINSVSVSYGTWVNDGFWHHVAVTRSNGTVYIFKDGVLLTSGSLTTAVPTSATVARIGNYYNGTTNFYYSGYIDDLRVTKGTARYTTSFTPPTSQLQDQ